MLSSLRPKHYTQKLLLSSLSGSLERIHLSICRASSSFTKDGDLSSLNLRRDTLGAGPSEEDGHQELVENMKNLNIESIDRQLSPSAVDISAYLADKRWNRVESSYVEKEDLIGILSKAKTLSASDITNEYTGNANVNLSREDVEMLLAKYDLPTIVKVEEKIF
mmetsp:Transcript_13280/g.15529  ORF Transcript_13280/g.15529 Transcript_13280/m.15529 type:complete len:164 (+) Transcript_13280:332-823(+)